MEDDRNDPGSRQGIIEEEILSANVWRALILISTAAVLLFSVYCLSHGITIIFMHLYYFPIVLLAYRYRYRGVALATLLSLAYVGLVVVYYPEPADVTGALYRFVVFVGIAAVIAYLSEQLAVAQFSQKERMNTIRDLQQFQESVITNANVWITVLATDGTIVIWNDAAEAISGYKRGDVLGKRTIWRDLYPDKAYRQNVTREIQQIIERDTYLENFETEIRCAGGTQKTIVWNTRGIRDEAGTIQNYIAIGRDITKQIETERENRRLASFPNLTPVMIMETDLKGNVLYSNPAMKAHLAVLGLSNPLVVVPAGCLEYIKRDSPGKKRQWKKEVIIQGRIFLENIFYVPEFDSVRIYVTDITERRTAEKLIAENSRFLNTLIDTLPTPLFYKDINGKYLGCNPPFEAFIGIHRDDLIGKTAYDIAPKELADIYTAADQDLFDSATPQRYETQVRFADGSLHDVIFYKAPFFGSNGKVQGLIGTYLDITDRKRTEMEFIRIAREWEVTFNATSDGICLIDADQNIQRCNNKMGEILGGMKLEDITGKPCWAIVHKTTGPIPECPFVSAKETLHRTKIEIPAGDLWFEVTADPILDSSGKFAGAVHIMRDVTERKRAEKQVQESEAKFREIFNSANDAIHLHEVDERGLPGKFIDVNEVACKMLQYSREELLEMSPLDLTTDYHSRPVEQIGEEIKTRGSALFETEFLRKDGVIVPVEVNTHNIVIQGKGMMISIIRDLTRRKQDEAAFLQLSADHKAIIDNAPAMIWYKDTKNNFIRVNPAGARAFGMAVEEIEGKSAYDLFPDFAEEYYQDDLQVITTGRPKLGIVEPFTTAAGERLWVQTDKIPLTDPEGTISGILAFTTDITERKLLEQEMEYHEQELRKFSAALETSNKKLNLLSSITRHDINNQLTVLVGFLELLEMKQQDSSFSDYFNKINDAAGRIQAMIQFTKNYEGIGVNAPVWQNIRTIADTAVKDITLGDIRLVNDIPADMTVYADQLVVKVFYNLVDNAVRYGDKITMIRFSVDTPDGDCVIACEDDGNGVPIQDKEKIFERGFGKNTGLGLFLSREILSITGITIKETGEPGKGARFEITVPKGGYQFQDSDKT